MHPGQCSRKGDTAMNKADKIAALLELERMIQKGKEDSAKVLRGGAWQIPVAEREMLVGRD